MPTYTDEQKAHAIGVATEQGAPAASKATGIHPATIRRWTKHAGLTPLDATPDRAEQANRNGEANKAEADEARTSRIGAAQRQLVALVAETGQISMDAATMIAATMGEIRLTQAAAVSASDVAWKGPPEGCVEGLKAADVMWRRVRILSDTLRVQALTFGLSVDKLVKLAGEDSPMPTTGGSASAVVNFALLLESDPEFRAEVIAGTGPRIAAARATEVTGSEVPT